MRSSDSSRALPNLLVVGVPKAGTGSLFSYLAQHPSVCPATRKEVGYFSRLIPENGELPDISWYMQHFSHCAGQRYLMEATPSYCFGGKRVLEAIKSTLTRPRFIIILRDPIDRLWSAYTFQRSLGNLPREMSFEAYLSVCSDQRRRGHEIVVRGHFNGLSIGFYGAYLGDWFDSFSDAVRVLFFEDLASDPLAVTADLCRWLTIDEEVAATFDYLPRNPTAHPRSVVLSRVAYQIRRRADALVTRVPALRTSLRRTYLRLNRGRAPDGLDPKTKEYVSDLYRESNRSVARLLMARGNTDLPAWLEDSL